MPVGHHLPSADDDIGDIGCGAGENRVLDGRTTAGGPHRLQVESHQIGAGPDAQHPGVGPAQCPMPVLDRHAQQPGCRQPAVPGASASRAVRRPWPLRARSMTAWLSGRLVAPARRSGPAPDRHRHRGRVRWSGRSRLRSRYRAGRRYRARSDGWRVPRWCARPGLRAPASPRSVCSRAPPGTDRPRWSARRSECAAARRSVPPTGR